MAKRTWLLKSEPGVYSIADLERDGTTPWEGVRNYQARNFMRDDMRVGDLVLFYHSNATPPGVAGVAKIARAAYPDPHAWDPKSRYYDPRSPSSDPVWMTVDVAFVERFADVVPLDELKANAALDGMLVVRRGQRLSVQPVDPEHFRIVREMGRAKGKRRASRADG